MSRATQVEKVIRLMANRPDQQWFKAVDFQKPDLEPKYFVGYEATARMSDAMRMYPTMFNVKKEGRFRLLQLKPYEVIREDPEIPNHIKEIVRWGYFNANERANYELS